MQIQDRRLTQFQTSMLILLMVALSSPVVSSFGVNFKSRKVARKISIDQRTGISRVSDTANGETSFENMLEGAGSLNETDAVLVVSEEKEVSPNAPPLTYEKFLTMQSKRVPVSIRYSADSGMKPYFLTMAKKIKDAHPDVVLERVILPRVEVGEGEKGTPTFEVLVDGKIVVRTPGRKDRSLSSSDLCVFVSKQEMETAISRARRKRRPSTAYGDDATVRLELSKSKPGKHSKD